MISATEYCNIESKYFYLHLYPLRLDHNLNVRIGDFGLTRDTYLTNYYKASAHTALPVKWMPPEMLRDGISNEMTDVVSF